MPINPNRDYEYSIGQCIRNILLEDTYFIQEFTNTRTNEFTIDDESLVLNIQGFYPKIAVYFDNEVEYTNQFNAFIKPTILIDVAVQHAKKKDAQKLSFMYLKDIKYTLEKIANLRSTINGELIQVAFSQVRRIEPTYFATSKSIWTYISTMEIEVQAA